MEQPRIQYDVIGDRYVNADLETGDARFNMLIACVACYTAMLVSLVACALIALLRKDDLAQPTVAYFVFAAVGIVGVIAGSYFAVKWERTRR